MISSEIKYTESEHLIWHNLYEKQIHSLHGLVHSDFFSFLDEIGLSSNHIPQLKEISTKLYKKTGWDLIPVPGIIPAYEFYTLLSEKHFPSTTFVRSGNDGFDPAPDIFHELFGHASMLIDDSYARFLKRISCFALRCNELEQRLIQRLLWFTAEVGLIMVSGQLKIYGGALLSSIEESGYAIKSTVPKREPFDLNSISRTPFRIDMFNEYYYYIEDLEQLNDLDISINRLHDCLNSVIILDERPVLFETKFNDGYSNTMLFPF